MGRLSFIKYDEASVNQLQSIKTGYEMAETLVDIHLTDSRAKALALTKLEESFMWIGKAIRDDQVKRERASEAAAESSI